jgi:glycine betaine/choline ABC-type transport system substrate-binding protein
MVYNNYTYGNKDTTIRWDYIGKVITPHQERAKRTYEIVDVYVTLSEKTKEVIKVEYVGLYKYGDTYLRKIFSNHELVNSRVIENVYG